MARPKLPRKSTNIDMTAMCDVAFLLLSFFILATKFKPQEAVPIQTPSSVQKAKVPEKDVVLVSIAADGKVFLSVSEQERRKALVNELNTRRSLGLSATEVQLAASTPFFGTPFSQFKSSLAIPKDKYTGTTLPGIPAKDSTNNELYDWMNAVVTVYKGEKMNLMLKGDMNSKFPTFKNVIAAFKRTDLLKFQMITNPEGVPEDSELFRVGQKTAQ